MLGLLAQAVAASAQSTMISYQSGLLSLDTYALKAYVDTKMAEILSRKK